MRVLLDKNVPFGVRDFLLQHEVETVEDRGWSKISNGELLRTAEAAGFEVVITADQNIVYQQNFLNLKLGLVVLGSNIWPIVRNHAEAIRSEVNSVKPASYTFIEIPPENKGERVVDLPTCEMITPRGHQRPQSAPARSA